MLRHPLQEYYTSGFLSLQAAIDAYTLGIPAQLEASLDVSLPGTTTAAAGGTAGANGGPFTEWGVVFPTAEYEHNDFYDAGQRPPRNRASRMHPQVSAVCILYAAKNEMPKNCCDALWKKVSKMSIRHEYMFQKCYLQIRFNAAAVLNTNYRHAC